jgi:hypothetical protein
VSPEATELVHHAQPITQENVCQEIIGQYKPKVWVHHLAGTPHLTDDLPTGVTDTTVASPGRSSLSLFFMQRKRAPKHTEHDKADQTFTFALPLSISQMA